jgi:hypothetical protein
LNNSKLALGTSLLLFGVLTLLDNFGIISFSFEKIFGYALMFYSIPTFYSSLNNSRRETLISSTILFLVGIIFLVKGYFQIIDSRGIMFASILFIGGAVLLVLFLENLKEKIFLTAGFVLILLSILSVTILKKIGLFDLSTKVNNMFEIFWPVILIIAGINLFINRKK